MIKAIVYIPPDVSLGSSDTHEHVAYAVRRDYDMPTICRSWSVAHGLLLAGWAQVIILAHGEHGADRGEAAGEVTRILQRRPTAVGRHSPPAEACQIAGQAQRLDAEIAAYRAGYADGFVDCVTLRGPAVAPPDLDSPTSPL